MMTVFLRLALDFLLLRPLIEQSFDLLQVDFSTIRADLSLRPFSQSEQISFSDISMLLLVNEFSVLEMLLSSNPLFQLD